MGANATERGEKPVLTSAVASAGIQLGEILSSNMVGIRYASNQPANEIPAKLTTLCSSMFHCSYRCNVPRACGTAFKNV